MFEKYNAEVFIESRWIEPEEITNYNPETHWNPQLYIENTYTEPIETIKYKLQRIGNLNILEF